MIPKNMLSRYFEHLVGRIYKILPLKQSEEQTVDFYLDSLLSQVTGVDILACLSDQPYYLDILGVISYLSENIDTCDVKKVKRQVFRAINLCQKMAVLYRECGDDDGQF